MSLKRPASRLYGPLENGSVPAVQIRTKRQKQVGDNDVEEGPFARLPEELLLLIGSKVIRGASSPRHWASFSRTCKRFHVALSDPHVRSQAGEGALAVRAATWGEEAERFLYTCGVAGNLEALFLLGMIHFYCLGLPWSGATFLARAALGGHVSASYTLAVIHFNGSAGTREDRNLAAGAKLCRRAADLGSLPGLRELGHCYQDGYGVPRDTATGRRILLQANARELLSALAAAPIKSEGIRATLDTMRQSVTPPPSASAVLACLLMKAAQENSAEGQEISTESQENSGDAGKSDGNSSSSSGNSELGNVAATSPQLCHSPSPPFSSSSFSTLTSSSSSASLEFESMRIERNIDLNRLPTENDNDNDHLSTSNKILRLLSSTSAASPPFSSLPPPTPSFSTSLSMSLSLAPSFPPFPSTSSTLSSLPALPLPLLPLFSSLPSLQSSPSLPSLHSVASLQSLQSLHSLSSLPPTPSAPVPSASPVPSAQPVRSVRSVPSGGRWARTVPVAVARWPLGGGGRGRCAARRCGRPEMREGEFRRCQQCTRAKYCTRTCQLHDWLAGHRRGCRREGEGEGEEGEGER